MSKGKRWIQDAIKRPGAFTAKARRAGLTTTAYAQRVLRKNSRAHAVTRRQAQLALTLRRLARRKR